MHVIELERGCTRVTVAPEAGGRLLQIEVLEGGVWTPLLVAPDDHEMLLDGPLLWGCYPMTPWPGRVDQACFTWNGQSFELPRNDGPHSIHGRGVYLPWDVRTVTQDSCQLEVELGPGQGWPMHAVVTQDIAASDAAISLRTTVSAREGASFPAGAGWHPWFRHDVRPGIEPQVRVVAAVHYQSSSDLIPTGVTAKPFGAADLASGQPIGGLELDDSFGSVTEPMTVRWGDLELTMRSSANLGHAVVYTRSPRGFCVEPQTCAPDAFNLAARGAADTGLVVVQPGRPLVAETMWTWTVAAESSDTRGGPRQRTK
jgi:aldose 1-epimerase